LKKTAMVRGFLLIVHLMPLSFYVCKGDRYPII
jgi:hypothetical protein